MGVDPITLIAGSSAVANTIGNISHQRGERRRQRRIEGMAMDQMQTGPSFLENLLRSQFNTGQDGQMQMLRGAGGRALEELAETGAPFDTSQLFEALRPVRQRQLEEGLGVMRAGAPGLGQRFGSAMMRGEELTVLEHLQNIGAMDAGINYQAHEAAQDRRLGAAQVGLGAQQNLMQLLMQAEQGRRGTNLGALQVAAGLPGTPQVSYGQPGFDIASLMLLQQLSPAGGGQRGTTQFQPRTAWTPPSFLR
jgi:hypothetical protein